MPLLTSRQTIARVTTLAAVIQSLCLYGAAAVAALGWAVARLLGFESAPWIPLWFFGMLFVYNVDRLHPDPADRLNVPKREARGKRLAPGAITVVALSGAALIVWPLFLGDLPLLILVLAAGLISLAYTVPMAGFRWKDAPLLKTFIPPSTVTAAYLIPPLFAGRLAWKAETAVVSAWVWLILMANMILCDRRDLAGDLAAGVRSLPVLLGPRRSLAAAAGAGLATIPLAAAGAVLQPDHRLAWIILAAACPVYIVLLCRRGRHPQSEAFYEWGVEGLFFVPPFIYLVTS